MSEPDVLATIGGAVRALRGRIDRSLQAVGLRLGQYQLLKLLWDEDGLTPRELSERLAVEMPTVTRTVQRMVRDGLARREAHPDDARSVRIYLTEHGLRLRDRVSELLTQETERALQGFTTTERMTLVELMNRVRANARHDERPISAEKGVH